MDHSSTNSHYDNNDGFDLNLDINDFDCWDRNLEEDEEVDEGIPDDEDLINNQSDGQNIVPKLGMEFQSDDQMYDFYNQYARGMGFSIRKGQVKKSNTGEIRKRVLLCSKEGFKDKHSRGTPQKEHPVTRTGCMARIQCILQGGLLVVKKFIEEHNHDLASASEAHLLRSQRRILPQQARYMDSIHSGGCGPTTVFRILSAEHGSSQQLNITQNDCKNYFQRRRRQIYKEGDAQVAFNYFRRMQRENPAFFYTIQVDQNNQACNLFWADAKSRIDYGFFGDVVCFDTTFRTNKYGMPCAPFVGVNHHGMSVLFGIALLIDESTESFVWVFESFLNAMSGKYPKTILTDQAQAIANAIERVMPNTHHRLCLWHIFQNAGKHLSRVYEGNKQFKKDFQICIYSCETEEDFESQWEAMINRYLLVGNEWLRNLHAIRRKWALAYGREHFCAGMTTTQRSESVNSFVKGYVNGTLCITDFITQYGKAVLNWREKENQADYNSKHTEPILITALPFEKQAAQIYTRKVFRTFQDTLKNFACYLEQIEDRNESIVIHKVEMVVPVKHDKIRSVYLNTKENTIECSCKCFQFTGILCVHVLRVLLSRRIFEIPSHYIIKRWTKQAKDGLIVDNVGVPIQANCQESSSLRYSDLAYRALTVAMKGSIDEGSSLVVKRHIAACIEELNAYQDKVRSEAIEVNDIECPEEEGEITIKDPPTKKKKGEQNKRFLNALERSLNKRNTNTQAMTGEEKETQQPIHKTTRKPQKRQQTKKINDKREKIVCALKDLTEDEVRRQIFDDFDPKIKEHIIERLEDVAPDGHCGYRCCAELLDMSKEDGWKHIRVEMLNELQNHKELYMTHLGGAKTYKEVGKALNFFGSGCTQSYWMKFPDMGFLFASTFNCVLCVISATQYGTYLPLRTSPPNEFKVISVVLDEDNHHFLKAFLKPGAPIPKVVPGWDCICYPDAREWETLVSAKFLEWESLIGYPPIKSSTSHDMHINVPVIDV